MTIEIKNDSTENVKVFGNLDSAVEYCQARLHENFTVSVTGNSRYQDVIRQTKKDLANVLSNAKVK